MNKQQITALMDWVEAAIDVKIELAFGRDPSHEHIREADTRDELLDLFDFGKGMK